MVINIEGHSLLSTSASAITTSLNPLLISLSVNDSDSTALGYIKPSRSCTPSSKLGDEERGATPEHGLVLQFIVYGKQVLSQTAATLTHTRWSVTITHP